MSRSGPSRGAAEKQRESRLHDLDAAEFDSTRCLPLARGGPTIPSRRGASSRPGVDHVGIDDDRNDARQTGSTTFEIWADGTKVADSGLRTWADPALTLSAKLTGARYLKLVLTDGGNTNSYDRGDWAAPRLTCS